MSNYRGRFAPSPTGRLHFGSLVSAVASHAQARSKGGVWLLRIEDLDPPREMAGAASAIVEDLARLGMVSDEPIWFQSDRLSVYQQALAQLKKQGLSFACACTRKQLADHTIYPGTCQAQNLTQGRVIRLRVRGHISFEDAIQGPIAEQLEDDVGAFIVRRGDGLIAYQLAVVVDDHAQGITEIVRGCDLLDNTPRQIYLQRCLDLSTPAYAHVPVALNQGGRKMSKQTGAQPIDSNHALFCLQAAWAFLGQSQPPSTALKSVDHFWTWARRAWTIEQVPQGYGIKIDLAPEVLD